jgi:hypothetical protein
MHLHIANISFEDEIASATAQPFLKNMEAHPFYMQLQFLPLLYGNKGDWVYTTVYPNKEYVAHLQSLNIEPPRLTHEPLPHSEIHSWGYSLSISQWAKEHHLHYEIPDWEIVREINSKAFSFLNTPKLPGAALIHNHQELVAWHQQVPGKKILKTCYGVSGRGHFHLHKIDDPSLIAFAEREWALERPLIAEPWVERYLDFSTQWFLQKDGKKNYLGFTLCQNDDRGHYRGTIVGDSDHLSKSLLGKSFPLFSHHLREAEHLLDLIRAKGYFGHVGFDAMLYNENTLQPIVEINARKTMGWVAIALRERHFPKHSLRLFLSERSKAKNPLLPFKISTASHQEIAFQKQLCMDFVDL